MVALDPSHIRISRDELSAIFMDLPIKEIYTKANFLDLCQRWQLVDAEHVTRLRELSTTLQQGRLLSQLDDNERDIFEHAVPLLLMHFRDFLSTKLPTYQESQNQLNEQIRSLRRALGFVEDAKDDADFLNKLASVPPPDREYIGSEDYNRNLSLLGRCKTELERKILFTSAIESGLKWIAATINRYNNIRRTLLLPEIDF